jgi:hypothetical protein
MREALKIVISIIAIILLLLGGLFKVESWEGASEMLIAGFSFLALLVIIYIVTDVNQEKKQITLSKGLIILGGILGAILFVLGALFRVESWPWASEMLIAGFSLILLVLTYKFTQTSPENRHISLPKGLVILGGIIVVLGAWFKIESWEGASELLIIGNVIVLLALGIYIYQAVKDKKYPLSITLLGLMLILAGALFKIESWEGGLELTFIGRLLLYLCVFVYSFKKIKEKLESK